MRHAPGRDRAPRPPLTRAAEGRPRRGTPDGTRQRLIAAAAEVFNRDGYFGTDTNAIARAAGYAPATFYKHFADKRAVLLAAYAGWVATEWQEIEQVRRRVPPGQRAQALTAWVLAHHRRWRGLRASLFGLIGADPVVRDFCVAQRRRQLDQLHALRDARRRRAGDRERDALLLWSFERTCDALANGEAEALGLDVTRLEALLVELMRSRHVEGRATT
ncbi:MAG: TetR/AcrR family transcriptional regulator [Deltaproteobacteria bacterium]|nr:TetR/AcrR family transcriptional regulator [Deltaproteobacteria bacterium]